MFGRQELEAPRDRVARRLEGAGALESPWPDVDALDRGGQHRAAAVERSLGPLLLELLRLAREPRKCRGTRTPANRLLGDLSLAHELVSQLAVLLPPNNAVSIVILGQ